MKKRPFDRNSAWRIVRLCVAGLIAIAIVIAVIQGCRGATLAEVLPAPVPSPVQDVGTVTPLDVTRDTPFGIIPEGGDISAAVKWACETYSRHQRRVAIPAGTWQLAPTRLPHASGFEMLGAGTGDPDAKGGFRGVRTVLRLAGKDQADHLLRMVGSHQHIGNFAIDGDNRLKAGLFVDKPGPGLGTGNSIVEPLYLTRMATGVLVGEKGDHNCECIRFRKIHGEHVGTLYHNVNLQGMDNVVEYLHAFQAVGVMAEISGGTVGVQQWYAGCPTTVLKINEEAELGPNNAAYLFTEGKIDSAARDGLMLVDSRCPNMVRITFNKLINSAGPMTINLAGSNFLKLRDCDTKFAAIEGKRVDGWGRPAVLMDACQLWSRPAEVLKGDISLRTRDCTNWQSEWIPDYPPSEWRSELEAAEKRINNRINDIKIKIEVPQ